MGKVLRPLIKQFNIVGLKSFSMPTKRKKITLNKSPHVFSKSKEQFELLTYTHLVRIPLKKNTRLSLTKLEQVLVNNVTTGLSIDIKN